MCLCKKQSIWGMAIPSRPSPKMEKKHPTSVEDSKNVNWSVVSKCFKATYIILQSDEIGMDHHSTSRENRTRKHCGSGIEHHAIEILVRNLSWQSFGSLLLGDLRPMALRHTEKMCRSRMWTMINMYIHIIYIYTI